MGPRDAVMLFMREWGKQKEAERQGISFNVFQSCVSYRVGLAPLGKRLLLEKRELADGLLKLSKFKGG